jgi:hypothetical protein
VHCAQHARQVFHQRLEESFTRVAGGALQDRPERVGFIKVWVL